MPSKKDKLPIDDYFIDGRTKMLPCQKERCRELYADGYSINGLARLFHVNKRTIQFLLFPERLAKNISDRQQRGGTMKYYDKDKHKVSMKKYRNKKSSLPDIFFKGRTAD